jgi:ComF family protein
VIADLLQGVKELIFPDNCYVCRQFLNSRHTRQLCPDCLKTLTPNTPPFCGLCSRHLDFYTVDGLCGSCRGNLRHYDKAWGAYRYDEPMRRLIHSFKYSGKTALRRTFLQLMSAYIENYNVPISQYDIIAPIPLHPTRLRERGFNQAEILSEGLAKHYQKTHRPQLLIRTQLTDSQTVLNQKQRFTNLKGAFKINTSENVTEKSILLVDDLLTTGATADSAAAALKDAGAAHVGIMALSLTDNP